MTVQGTEPATSDDEGASDSDAVVGSNPQREIKGLSPARLAYNRFRKDRLSMISFVVVAAYLILAVLAPVLVKLGVLDYLTAHQNLLNVELGGIPNGTAGGISGSHPLGVEPGTGRDTLSLLWYGITFSLGIALTATIISLVIGAVLGIISGFSGGLVDATIGRLIDLTLSFPQTLILLALSTLGVAVIAGIPLVTGGVGGPMANGIYVVVVLGIFGWPVVARLIRGQVLSIREREFIEAATLMGASRWRIYFKEILPNVWAPLLVSFTLTMPTYISAEAALAYLGVGIKPPVPTLGNLLKISLPYSQADFFYFFFPALLIAIIVVSFNLLGDGLRDALDPKADR